MKKETTYDFVGAEHEVLKLWEENDALTLVKEKNKNSKEHYKFLDGPVTANAPMCIHHAWGRTLKDAFIRYQTMKGRKMHYQYGFDCQGMWVEVEVEKLLGLNDKKAILDYGMDNFTEKCMERVNHFIGVQTAQSIRLGQLADWENPYKTNDDKNILAIWAFLKKCNENGWLKRSYKTMPWCPRCGTSLSEHEMSGSYKERTHASVFVKAPLETGEDLLVWTTTPWTLAANVAVAVHPEQTYVKCKIKSSDRVLIVGKNLYKRVLKGDLIAILGEVDGASLAGLKYTPFLKLAVQDFEHKVVAWTEVSESDGSGAVHIAPGCGAEDFELGKSLGLKQIIPVDEAGAFYPEFENLAKFNSSNCEETVFEMLKENETFYTTEEFTHNYPFCWRCKTDVIFRLVEGWDIETREIKPLLKKLTNEVKWEPEFTQKSMLNWLDSMGDWNISRRRFYGLPLPIYPCKKCGTTTVIGSREELEKLSSKEKVATIPHLHRPYIDKIKITCPHCKAEVERIPEVGDCWLDAGVTALSTKGYFDDKAFFKENFPIDFVVEMKEQVRLWFYSLLFITATMTGKAPYKRVVGHGTVLDVDGKKFSKTGPKKISLDDASENFGSDAIRYVYASGNPALDVRFGNETIEEAKRKMLSFWNSYVFYTTYASIDNPNLSGYAPNKLKPTDVWLIDATNRYIKECDDAYADFKPHLVIAATEKFADALSNFYIRSNRRRFWKGTNDTDKLNGYFVLNNALRAITLALHPITPFITEHIYQNLWANADGAPSLAVICDFPKPLVCAETIKDIAAKAEFAQKIISMALSLRAEQQIKIKQPLSKLYVKATADAKDALELFGKLIRDEINVKELLITEDEGEFNEVHLTVNFKNAGAVLKGEVQQLKMELEQQSTEEMQSLWTKLSKSETVNVGKFENLTADLFVKNLKSKSGFIISTEGETTVVLDAAITDELKAEGILREIIRAVQVERQNKNLDITTRIELNLYTENAEISQIIAENAHEIAEETLAQALTTKKREGAATLIDGDELVITIN
ncbi:MAG: isoleucine--tRNA ligase [Christensenellaceae bacterium]|jgi:isoleucyl-tRNA synthetase|nr:isoleucine--tRNA ligase [Christensenellaceae bacterium]